MKTRREWLATSLAAGLAALPWGARAQAQWPTRAVRFVVPFVPGGTSDIVARTTANELTRLLGSPVVIDNRQSSFVQLYFASTMLMHFFATRFATARPAPSPCAQPGIDYARLLRISGA